MANSQLSMPTTAIQIRSTHVRLLVNDFDAEFRFFRDVLGFQSSFGAEGDNYADFDCNGASIALFKRNLMNEAIGLSEPSASGPGNRLALIFGVSNVDEVTAQLRARGIAFVTEPHDRPVWGIRVAHFRDPEGNLIEINSGLGSD
jgi:catechol 2,3-dioxygenase-like lactoylglutathione lyase family enzyme